MKNRLIFIAAALECIDLIQSYTEDYDLPSFLADRKTQDAVVRNLEILRQALKDFGADSLFATHPDMPWREITGMRNILAHEYLGVDPVMIWDTIQTHMDELRYVLEDILR